MRPKVFLVLSIFLLSILSSYSQITGSNGLLNAFKTNPKLKFGMQAGTSFSSFGSGISLLSNQVSPYLKYKLNPKISFEIGTSFTTYHSGNLSFISMTGNPASNSVTGISGYATGRYQANEKLLMSGSIYRESSVFPSLSANPGAFEFVSQGVSFGLDYKLNDRISFGAGVKMMQVSSPWGAGFRQQNPFQRNFFDY